MGWASGFQAGTSMAKQWLDTYNEAERRRQFEGIQKAKEFEQYTPQQGEQLRGLSEQVDEQGRPRYQFEIDPGSTQYRVREIMYPQERPEIEGYSPTWLGRDMGPAPQQGAEVYTSPVPMDGLDVRTVLDSNAPGYTRDATPINRGLGFYPAMGAEAADTAPRSYTDLTTNAPEYSPDLRISRPDDSAAYRGLTREMGEAQNFAPGQVNYLGKTYAPGGLTPEVRRAAQLEAYADVIARDNPLEAERLRSMVAQEKRAAAAETRAAELFPMQKESLTIELDEKRFTADERKKTRALEDFIAANPNLPTKDIVAKAQELKLGPKVQAEAIKQLTGVTTADMERSKVEIANLIKDKSFDELLAEHKNNQLITPGSHYEAVRDAKGNVALYMVDTATGKRLTEAPDFTGTVQEADKYLRTAATDTSALLDYSMNLRNTKAGIAQKEASTEESLAKGEYYRMGGRAGRSGSGGGLDTRTYTALVGEARMLSSEIDRLTAVVNDPATKPEMRKSAQARLNDAVNQYEEVNGIIRQTRGGGAAPQGGAGRTEYVPGREYTWTGKDGKDEVWVYTGDPSQGNNGFVRKETAKTEGKTGLKSEPPKASPSIKAAPVEPKNREEWTQSQRLLQDDWEPAGRGNSWFGEGEILYKNRRTGETKWASQLPK